jgi:hypothetical protein
MTAAKARFLTLIVVRLSGDEDDPGLRNMGQGEIVRPGVSLVACPCGMVSSV